MFGRKKVDPPRRTEGGKALMAQMGFMTSIDDMVLGSPDDDDDLEAELRALQRDDSDDTISRKKAKLKSPAELEKIIALSMKDVPSDEEVSDTEDPDLMAELEDLMSDDEPEVAKSPLPSSHTATTSSSMIQLLQERIDNYNGAITNSRVDGDQSKVRRYERGMKTLQDMLKEAKANKPISELDIPPMVAMLTTKPLQDASTPIRVSPTPKCDPPIPPKITPSGGMTIIQPIEKLDFTSHVDLSSRHILKPSSSPPKPLPRTVVMETPPSAHPSLPSARINPGGKGKLMIERDLLKSEALKLKKMGENEKAVDLLKASKQYDLAITALEEGQNIDGMTLIPLSTFTKGQSNIKPINAVVSPTPAVQSVQKSDKPLQPGNLLESLVSRMEKYKETEKQANEESNPSKSRRMGRIVKQYEEVIRMHKKGQPCDLGELPCPPGFPPLQGAEPVPAPQQEQTLAHSLQPTQSPQKVRPPVPAKTTPKDPMVQRQTSTNNSNENSDDSLVSTAHSRAEQQACFLENRQLKFKQAAIQAKATGDLELAKKYMRMAKGFDQMIEASRSGLPVDLSQIPAPPGYESDFVFVQNSDVPADISGDAKDVYKRLQDDLVNQIKTCEGNRDMFTKLGDISSATKFEKLREGSIKDLESVKNAFQHGDPVPRFHYETRQFSIVRCCPDLGDNDLEVTIVRGINFNPPQGYSSSDLHTYVKYEFPFQDAPQTGETSVVKGTDSPEFNLTSKLEVKRNSRSFLRMIKSSKTFKFDVYYRRGFLKSDKLLGSAFVKLQPLEDICVYHESFDLMEGRKAVGGKLEVKIRIRDPFVNKQVDETKEKWLVIDDFVRKPMPFGGEPAAPRSSVSPQKTTAATGCISVLMYEKDILDRQVVKYQNKLKPADIAALKQKSAAIQKTLDALRTQLQGGGTRALQDYLSKLQATSQAYAADAKSQAVHNATDKVKIILTKRTLVEKEIESISRKLQTK